MTNVLGQLADRYEILQKLKEGGMGAIYKVRHRLLDEVRVVKVMRPHLEQDPSMRRRFLQEAKNAIKVRHSNVAQLYDFSIDDDGTALMVMEFIDGVTLQDIIASGSLPSIDLAVEIAIQSLEAIGCLHQRGIIHRDISTDNLMVTRGFDGRPLVKAIDLGIAKDPRGGTTETKDGDFVGKVRYSAPEQFRGGGARALQPSSDLYSFAVVLYELLTGRLPVDGETFAELATGHLMRPPVPFEQSDPHGRVPEELGEIVMHTLAKDPAKRPPSAEKLIELLTPFRSAELDLEALDRLLRLARPVSPAAGPEGAAARKLERETDRLCELIVPQTIDPPTSELVATIDAEARSRSSEDEPARSQDFDIDPLDVLDGSDEPTVVEAPRTPPTPESIAVDRFAGRRILPMALVAVALVSLAAVSVVAWKSLTRSPLQGKLQSVLAMNENTERDLQDKLDAVNDLIGLPEYEEQSQQLASAKRQLVDLLEYNRQYKRLRSYNRLERLASHEVEAPVRALWEGFEEGLGQYSNHPFARELRAKASEELRQIAETLNSPSLFELLDAQDAGRGR